jgi:hypothetical protein
MKGTSSFFIALALSALMQHEAKADCPPPPAVRDTYRQVETKGAIGKILELAGVDLSTITTTKVKDAIQEYPNADQTVVSLTLISTTCMFLLKSTNISDERKLDILMQLTERLSKPVSGPTPIASTSPKPPRTLPSPQEQLKLDKPRSELRLLGEYAWASSGSKQTPTDAAADGVMQTKSDWAGIYLNDPPLLITSGNKHFVIVASAQSSEEGRRAMIELKKKYPSYDFELYAPYANNPHYALMIASWTSMRRAQEALRIARRINPSSFIWSCRSSDDGKC